MKPRRSHNSPHDRGFTLLEVLIALAIVTLSVGALLGTVTSSASNIIYLKDKTIGEWVALNRLTEIRIAQTMPDPGKRTGNAEMAGMRWQWEEEVIELPVKGMFRVDVRARPTGETVDDNRPAAQSKSQTPADTKPAGSELDKLSWTATATGVVGASRAQLTQPIPSPFAELPATSGPNKPGVPKAPPGTPSS